MITTREEAIASGRQWALDRMATGSEWSEFMFDDALALCETQDPSQRRALAYLVCDTAIAHLDELKRGKP